MCLNDEDDQLDRETLPKGKMPLLILRDDQSVSRREDDLSYSEVLGFIADHGLIDKEQSVTIIGKQNCFIIPHPLMISNTI